MNIVLYGLLHLAKSEKTSINVRVHNFIQQTELYLRNAIVLSHSLQSKGIRFVLLTNRQEELEQELARIGFSDSLEIEDISFTLNVPSGVKFYSAHHKLDAFKHLGELIDEDYVGLIDLDMIALGSIPQCFKNLVEKKIPIFYDISDQVIPAYGHELIMSDMQKMWPGAIEARWSGGELIMGSPNFFKLLSHEVFSLYDYYAENAAAFHHQGDEMITSVALEKMRHDGIYISDGGTLGLVGRFWSCPTLHPQKPLNYFKNCFLLHLPGDKKFLASLDPSDVDSHSSFFQRYHPYLRQGALIKSCKVFISNYLKKR